MPDPIRQDQFPEQLVPVDMDDFKTNFQFGGAGNQTQIAGSLMPFQPRSNRASWEFDTSTADSDPGSGNLRFNNTTQGSTTFVYISNTDKSGIDWGAILLATPVGHVFSVEESGNRYQNFQTTGAAIDGTNYAKIPVSVVGGGSNIRNGATVSVYGVETAASSKSVMFKTVTSNHTVDTPMTFVDPSSGDVTVTLADGAEWTGIAQTVQRVANGGNTVSIQSTGGMINGYNTSFVFGNMNDVATFFYDGSDYFVTSRLSNAIAAITLSAQTTANITTSFTKLDIFDIDSYSTPGRLVGDAANAEIDILTHPGGGAEEGYRVDFTITFEAGNGDIVDAQVFIGGVAVPSTLTTSNGLGSGRPTSIGINLPVGISSISEIDVRLKANATLNNTTIYNAALVVTRIAG